MDAFSVATPRFTVGAVLGRGFSIWGKHIVAFTLIALITHGPSLGHALYQAFAADDLSELIGAATGTGQRLAQLLEIVCSLVSVAALIHAISQALRGRPVQVGASLMEALRRLLPILALVLTIGLVVALFVLIMIPVAMILRQLAIVVALVAGLWLLVQLWVAMPALVLEGAGPIESLQRSSSLTLGHRWHILGIVLLVYGIPMVVTIGVTLVLMSGSPSVTTLRLGLLLPQTVALVVGGLSATINVVAYHDLRAAKEGVSVDDIARVFD